MLNLKNKMLMVKYYFFHSVLSEIERILFTFFFFKCLTATFIMIYATQTFYIHDVIIEMSIVIWNKIYLNSLESKLYPLFTSSFELKK